MNIFVLLSILFLYISSLSNTIFGGDAGDLVSAILTKGFPHPPGYPLYTMLGIIANILPLSLSPAGKITLISLFSTFFSLIIFVQIIREIAAPKYIHTVILSAVTYFIGFNYLIWLYSIIPEVFPLNTAITLSLFYSAIKWHKAQKIKFLYLMSFLIGLGITHHHTFVLVIPSVIYLIYIKRKKLRIMGKEKAFIALSFLTGTLPLIYLLYHRSEVVWDNTRTIAGFIAVLTRAQYGSFTAGSFITNLASHRILQIKNLLFFMRNDFTIWGLIIVGVGLIFYFTRKKSETKTLLTALMLNIFLFGPAFLFYANFPLASDIYFATVERYLIIYYFFLGLLLYFGFYWAYTLCNNYVINRLVDKTYFKKSLKICILIMIWLLPFQLFMKNKRFIYPLNNDRTAENFGTDILRVPERNALLLASSDTVLFNTQYIYHAYPHLRKNITFIDPSKFKLNNDYQHIIQSAYPKMRIVPFDQSKKDFFVTISSSLILPNISVYDAIYSDMPHPLKSPTDYTWIPYGMLYKLEKKSSAKDIKNREYNEWFWKNSSSQHIIDTLKKDKTALSHFFTREIVSQYAGGHQRTAYYYLELDQDLNTAKRHIQDSIFLEPDNSYNYLLLSNYYFRTKQCNSAEKTILDKTSLKSNDFNDKYRVLFLSQLDAIGSQCYTDKKDKERIKQKLKKLTKSISQPLEKF